MYSSCNNHYKSELHSFLHLSHNISIKGAAEKLLRKSIGCFEHNIVIT
jgi:hypothetical protein